jgi:hypothetical protein
MRGTGTDYGLQSTEMHGLAVPHATFNLTWPIMASLFTVFGYVQQVYSLLITWPQQ